MQAWARMIGAGFVLAMAPMCASGQISLSSAIDLALRNSPQVRVAQADLDKAKALLGQAKDVYIPAITATGGIGESAGVPLSLPVIFSITAQSLAFNFSQPDFIRSAKAGVAAAQFSLDAVRETVVEDTISTYVTLDNAGQRKAALAEASGFAARLLQIAEDRYNAGADPHSEVTKAHRTGVQLRLQALLVNDEMETLSDHLGRLTGLPAAMVATQRESIPQMAAESKVANSAGAIADSYSVQAAFANATARQYQAHGDQRYHYLPQLAFGAGFSRVSTIGTNYSDYYPGFDTSVSNRNQQGNLNSLNSLDVGIQISVPILDYLHRSKARESAAEAARALAEAEHARIQFGEGQLRLAHAEAELAAKAELASLDRDLAQDQLDAVMLQLQANVANAQGTALNPKDEQNARLQERERYLDMLAAQLQLQQTQVSQMQQTGSLGGYVQRAIPSAMPSPGAVAPPGGGAGTVTPVTNAPIATPTPGVPQPLSTPTVPASTGTSPRP